MIYFAHGDEASEVHAEPITETTTNTQAQAVSPTSPNDASSSGMVGFLILGAVVLTLAVLAFQEFRKKPQSKKS